jgi:hypothetical protein
MRVGVRLKCLLCVTCILLWAAWRHELVFLRICFFFACGGVGLADVFLMGHLLRAAGSRS